MTRPIRDPHQGHYQVVASWRAPAPKAPVTEYRDAIERLLRRALPGPHGLAGLDVAVRVIGQGGEASEHEGTVGLAITEDTDDPRIQTDVPTGGLT